MNHMAHSRHAKEQRLHQPADGNRDAQVVKRVASGRHTTACHNVNAPHRAADKDGNQTNEKTTLS